MNENGAKSVNVLLSREELLLVLRLLQAPTLAGLDADPAGELDAAQQAVAFTVAERALRARELAQLRPSGELAIHTALLAAIGVCAYPQTTIFVYHWPVNGDAAIRYFGHVRAHEIVVHTRPADVLHLFSRLPSTTQLVTQLLAACGWEDGPPALGQPFTIPTSLFADIRRMAMTGAVQGAMDLLRPQRIVPESARAFIMTLAEAPRLSVVQMRKQVNGTVQARDFTLVQNSQRSWLVTNAPGAEEAVTIKAVNKPEVAELFTGWLQ